MEIGFDPSKNERNILERGLDFRDVAGLGWDSALVRVDNRRDYGEERYRAFLEGADGKPYVVVFTMRGPVMWVISFRRAHEKERRTYGHKT